MNNYHAIIAVLVLFCTCFPVVAASNYIDILTTSKNEAESALDDARRFKQSGEYAKSLERYEWFHNNALHISPSLTGVRLSSALEEWIDLGKKYPPAIQALKKIRDDKVNNIENGKLDVMLFNDIVNINYFLGDSAQSTNLFKKLDKKQPEFAKKCFEFFKDSLFPNEILLKSKEYDLYLKYAGDLREYLSNLINTNLKLKEGLNKSDARDLEVIKFIDESLIETTLTLSKLMLEKGNESLSLELKTMTAKIISDPRLLSKK